MVVDADEPRPLVRGAHGVLGRKAADHMGLFVVGPVQPLGPPASGVRGRRKRW